ncbi:MAG: hypothetical protein Q6373_003515 [Candidatus Sigynarchaeota archaeon]
MPIPPDCTGCSEFNPAVIPHTIVLFVLSPIVLITTIVLLIKSVQRKKLTTFSLALSFLLFTGVIAIPIVANVQSFVLGYRPAWVVWTNPSVYFLLCMSIFFLFIFCAKIFFQDVRRWMIYLYLAWGLLAGTLIILPQNNWGITGASQSFRLIAQVHLLLYLVVTFSIAINGAFRTARTINIPVQKVSLHVIGYGSVILIAAIACTVIDTLLGLILGPAGTYSFVGTLTWIFAAIGLMCFYIGFIQPSWFKKRFDKAKSETKRDDQDLNVDDYR